MVNQLGIPVYEEPSCTPDTGHSLIGVSFESKEGFRITLLHAHYELPEWCPIMRRVRHIEFLEN